MKKILQVLLGIVVSPFILLGFVFEFAYAAFHFGAELAGDVGEWLLS